MRRVRSSLIALIATEPTRGGINKVEEVKEKIENELAILRHCIEYEHYDYHYDAVLEAVDRILSIPEILIKDPDQSLPETARRKLGYSPDIDRGQLSLIHNNWVKVLPKEAK